MRLLHTMTLSSLTILWLFGASLLPGCDASNNSACARLASTLSAAYRSDQHFHPSDQPLESYLDHNGVLLTMCMRYGGMIPWMECSRKDGDTKLSASWVHTNQTRGWRVIGKPVDKGPPVGLALKPTETTIRCLYPVDGVTDARDGNGCGPLSSDARYGSQGYDHLKWYKKMLLKENIMHYKNAVYGSNVTWDSIPCSDFFQMPPDTDTAEIPLLSRMNDSNKTGFVYLTQANMQIDKWSYIMGFPVCNQSMPPPAPTFEKQILLYMGKTWWKSEDWNSIISLMDSALDSHPSLNIWNELVLNVPPAPDDFEHRTVQAVFFVKQGHVVIDEISKRIAQREAKRMKKPVLYLDQASYSDDAKGNHDGVATIRGGDLFHCETDGAYLRGK